MGVDSVRFYRVSLEAVVGGVRRVLGRWGQVEFAVLFGSSLRRSLVRDVDLAVYSRGRLGLEGLLRLGVELEEELGVPVDLVPLEDAPIRNKTKKPRRYKILFRYLEKPAWWDRNMCCIGWADLYQSNRDWRAWREYPRRYYVDRKNAEQAFRTVKLWANIVETPRMVDVECKVVDRWAK